MAWVPTVIENEGGNRERAFDIYSRLLRDRIVIVGRPIDDIVANLIVAQLIFLAAEDPDKEIQMYVNSPGGAVASGLAIYDTMQYIKPPISTVAVGRTASFGTVLLMAGTNGKRFALPNARIHLHQPLIAGRGLTGQATDLDIHAREIIRIKDELNSLIAGRGLTGQATDLDIHAREILRIKNELNEMIARHTGQPLERVERDTDRDFYLSPQEAIDYGLIDGVIELAPEAALAATAGGVGRAASAAPASAPDDGSGSVGTADGSRR